VEEEAPAQLGRSVLELSRRGAAHARVGSVGPGSKGVSHHPLWFSYVGLIGPTPVGSLALGLGKLLLLWSVPRSGLHKWAASEVCMASATTEHAGGCLNV